MNKHIKKAVDLVGSQAELARKIKKSPVFVHQMLSNLKRVPAELCGAIESSTDGKVTRYDLRPDVFGEAPVKSKKVRVA